MELVERNFHSSMKMDGLKFVSFHLKKLNGFLSSAISPPNWNFPTQLALILSFFPVWSESAEARVVLEENCADEKSVTVTPGCNCLKKIFSHIMLICIFCLWTKFHSFHMWSHFTEKMIFVFFFHLKMSDGKKRNISGTIRHFHFQNKRFVKELKKKEKNPFIILIIRVLQWFSSR